MIQPHRNIDRCFCSHFQVILNHLETKVSKACDPVQLNLSTFFLTMSLIVSINQGEYFQDYDIYMVD